MQPLHLPSQFYQAFWKDGQGSLTGREQLEPKMQECGPPIASEPSSKMSILAFSQSDRAEGQPGAVSPYRSLNAGDTHTLACAQNTALLKNGDYLMSDMKGWP